MPASKDTTVAGYLAALPEDRRAAVSAVRAVIKKNLPAGYEEGIQYGMIGYFVPHALYPSGYHAKPSEPLPFVHLASQKSHMALYLMNIYGDAKLLAWFTGAFAKAGKKLDMGKACVRFKRIEDLPLDVIGQAIAKVPVAAFIKRYEATIGGAKPNKSAITGAKAERAAAKAPSKKAAASAAKKAKPKAPAKKVSKKKSA
jgi:hypothetical protein